MGTGIVYRYLEIFIFWGGIETGIGKSLRTGIGKIWYQKKYRYRYRKYLVPEKVSVSVLFDILGTVTHRYPEVMSWFQKKSLLTNNCCCILSPAYQQLARAGWIFTVSRSHVMISEPTYSTKLTFGWCQGGRGGYLRVSDGHSLNCKLLPRSLVRADNAEGIQRARVWVADFLLIAAKPIPCKSKPIPCKSKPISCKFKHITWIYK